MIGTAVLNVVVLSDAQELTEAPTVELDLVLGKVGIEVERIFVGVGVRIGERVQSCEASDIFSFGVDAPALYLEEVASGERKEDGGFVP